MWKICQKAKNISSDFVKYWNSHIWVGLILVFSFVGILYASVYVFNPGLSTLDDHLFHFKLAYLLRTQGWDVIKNFGWIYYSTARQNHVRYELSLFQVVLVPFTYIKDMVLGLKLSDIFWGSAALSIFYYALRKSGGKFPLVFTALLVSNTVFMDRMLMGRAFVLIIPFTFLEMYLAVDKKYKSFFAVALFHALWHQATFFMPLMTIFIVECARYLAIYKISLKNILSAVSAMVISMVFFPYFPMNMVGYIKGVFPVQNPANGGIRNVQGTELASRSIFDLFSQSDIWVSLSLVSIFFLFFFYIVRGKNRKFDNTSRETIFIYSSCISVLLFFFGTIQVSGRLSDYYLVAAIFSVSLILAFITKESILKVDKSAIPYIAGCMIIFLVIAIANSFLARKMRISWTDYRPIAQASQWVDLKTEQNKSNIIFLDNWSSFPTAFFFNSNDVYAIGIEPGILLDYDNVLFWKWYNMFRYAYYCDQEKDCINEKNDYDNNIRNLADDQKSVMQKENSRKIIESIKNDFNANYIITTTNLGNIIKLNPDMISDEKEIKSEWSSTIAQAFVLK